MFCLGFNLKVTVVVIGCWKLFGDGSEVMLYENRDFGVIVVNLDLELS